MQRIYELNAERGWTLYELSNQANISVYTLYACKNKNHEPSNETLRKICDAYGITLFQFYHDIYDIAEFTELQKNILQKIPLLNQNEIDAIEHMIDTIIEAKYKNKN